jgi:tetrahydromethanopterin S-methyltransferase subunit D
MCDARVCVVGVGAVVMSERVDVDGVCREREKQSANGPGDGHDLLCSALLQCCPVL